MRGSVVIACMLLGLLLGGCTETVVTPDQAEPILVNQLNSNLRGTFEFVANVEGSHFAWDFGDYSEPEYGNPVWHSYLVENGKFVVRLTVDNLTTYSKEIVLGTGNANPFLLAGQASSNWLTVGEVLNISLNTGEPASDLPVDWACHHVATLDGLPARQSTLPDRYPRQPSSTVANVDAQTTVPMHRVFDKCSDVQENKEDHLALRGVVPGIYTITAAATDGTVPKQTVHHNFVITPADQRPLQRETWVIRDGTLAGLHELQNADPTGFAPKYSFTHSIGPTNDYGVASLDFNYTAMHVENLQIQVQTSDQIYTRNPPEKIHDFKYKPGHPVELIVAMEQGVEFEFEARLVLQNDVNPWNYYSIQAG